MSFTNAVLNAVKQHGSHSSGKSHDDFNNLTRQSKNPFAAMCRLAGTQRNNIGAAPDGCTTTLRIILKGIKKDFDKISRKEKKKYGLDTITSEQLNHYHLLQIGIFGKVVTNSTTSPDQRLALNNNLKEFYKEKHSSSLDERVGTYPSKLYRKCHQDEYPKITPSNSEHTTVDDLANNLQNKIYDINYGPFNLDEVVTTKGTPEPRKIKPNEFFIQKMEKAVDEYKSSKTGIGSMIGFFRSQSDGSKKLQEALSNALQIKSDAEKKEAIVNALDTFGTKAGTTFKNILRDAGFIDNDGISMVSMKSDTTNQQDISPTTVMK